MQHILSGVPGNKKAVDLLGPLGHCVSMTEMIPMFDPDVRRPMRLLKACPVYAPSPLTELSLDDGTPLLVKDEAHRMNLGSFKAMGGVYAVACLIDEAWQAAGNAPLNAADYASDAVRVFAADMTFVCASAGNHGLSVAAGAKIFGAKARIHLSAEVPPGFDARLVEVGAEPVRSGATYEDSIAAAIKDADDNGAIHLADGSWPGYTHPPSLVMEGYTVIAEEMRDVFSAGDMPWPSHVYLQAGVGGLAGGMTAMIRRNWDVQPVITIVEPEAAACLMRSAEAGAPARADGPVSNMGRLDCKEPSILAHNLLSVSDVNYVTVSDADADRAAEWLGARGLGTTPSGAAGLAGLWASDETPERPLIIVSEGAV